MFRSRASVSVLLLFATCTSEAVAQSVQVRTITTEIAASGGVSVGPDGAIYVADFGASLSTNGGTNVLRVMPDGSHTVFATGLHGASGNAFDDSGNLYQSNIGGGVVSRITPDGTVSTYASDGIVAPVGVAVDEDGNVYNTNCQSPGFITRTTPDGVTSVYASSAFMSCPNGLTIDDDGNLYTANFNNGRVVKIDADGTVSVLALVNSSMGNGHLTFANGRLYVCNWSGRIYELMLDGQFRVLAGTGGFGTRDGPGTEATFFRPNGISASVTGDTLYVNQSTQIVSGSQLHPNVVRMITGILSTTGTDKNADGDSDGLFGLLPNYPNPFADHTTIRYSLSEASYVSLDIVDVLGRNVVNLDSGFRSPGVHVVEWQRTASNGQRLVRGLYMTRLRAGRNTDANAVVAM